MAGNQLPYPRNASGTGGGSGTVTSVSVTTANGVSGSVATATTTPAISLTLGAITPSTVNALTLASQTTGFTIAGGTTSKTLTVPLDASVSGTNTGDQTNISGNAGTSTTAPTTAILVSQASPQTLGVTGARLTKLWATDIESTNMPTVGGTAILSSLTAPSFTTGTFTGASSLTLGTASSLAGGIIFKNGTNANTLTLQSGVTGATIAYTLPITAPTDGQVLSCLATGVMSWTTASGLSWASSITGTSGTGLTLTVGNSASASTVGQSIVIGNTQTNAATGLSINTGTSVLDNTGLLVTALKGYAVGKGGVVINSYSGATQAVGSIISLRIGDNFNTSSAATSRLIQVTNEHNATSYNTGIWINSYETQWYAGNGGAGLQIFHTGTGGTAFSIDAQNNTNSSTNGLVNYNLSNTQSAATVMQKIDLGTSAQGHTGLKILAYGASTNQRGIYISSNGTGTGNLIELDMSSANSAGASCTGIYMGSLYSGNAVDTTYGIRQLYVSHTSGAAGDSGNSYGFYQDNVCVGHGSAYGFYQGNIGNGANNTNAIGWYVGSLNGSNTTEPIKSQYFSLNNGQSGTMSARTVDTAEWLFSRTNTRTSTTVADSYNLLYMKDTAVQNGVGGTLTSAGSVLKLETVATTTAGSLTYTKAGLYVKNGSGATGNPISVEQNNITSTNFRKIFTETNTGVTIWVSNGNTPNGALSGNAGDICFNGASSRSFYCTGTTNWTASNA